MNNTKRLLVKNIPKTAQRNEVIDRLKTLCHNSPLVTITMPLIVPPTIELPSPDTTIALISVNDITQMPNFKTALHGKVIGENKLQVEIYDIKPQPPKKVALPTQTKSSTVATTTTPTQTSFATKAKSSSASGSTTTTNTTKTATSEERQKKSATATATTPATTTPSTTTTTTTTATTQQDYKRAREDGNGTSEGDKVVTKKKKSDKVNGDNKIVAVEKKNEETNGDDDDVDVEGEDEEQEVNGDAAKKKVVAPPSVRNNKKVVNKITQQLVFFSEKKDFQQIRNSYNYLKRIGARPDHIAFGVLLNSCVRCQEWGMAKEVFDDAINSEKGANEVIYTTFIKALCETDMPAAEAMVDTMKQVGIPPNARSYNSVLRGCIRSGDVDIAQRLYTDMKKQKLDDSSTIEYLIKIYAQHLMITDCWQLLGDKYEAMETEISPIVFSRLSLAALLAGDLKSAVKALGIIDDILSRAPRSIGVASQSHKNKGKKSESNKVSASLFERINRQEINEESERVRACLQRLSKQQVKVKCQPMEWSKKIFFSPVTFSNLYKANDGQMEKNSSFMDMLLRDSRDQANPRPVKMEICSGHGHWITKRAAEDSESDWLSVEIRYDRVFQIWSKMILESIDNLYLMAGDAHEVLKSNVPTGTLDEVYINYPNPPVWPGAKRLIDHDFLVEINRSLKKDGTLTIVTDDKPYADSIVLVLRQSKKLARIYKPVKEDYICPLEEDYGYSYFNKLWSNGQRMKRYCIYVIKDC
ncbi:hypothetical protein SAMD00019534_012940 [Acytostelium subglobosum LB1]|uniref:hypothetical protein n=1 Tax=Acytostelium subglobosum LB1 TaxID=1410327 RepID=UPI00064482DB|nr:hypothetical protein SAMD00019534_012940 [Acytostelium subglobosum LB1]GAM18119.1 hypothetical protein SAMD00019534_012940 [Acytostelium subglobosum LB1]|eukprot:XP_012758715.1 hypothetical protein SAMD00019534_012940 [Acytostelium subglobosum LB1]